MRGIVFTEFLAFVEEGHGYAIVDQLLQRADLPSGGHYTAVGAYDFTEMVELLTQACQLTDRSASDMLRAFGQYILPVFEKNYPDFFLDQQNAFDFLSTIEDKIHPQVLKLYPDAELPKFDITRSEDELIMVYRSSRSMGDFAHGLIEGCLEMFDTKAQLVKENLSEDGSAVRFILTRIA